jgi:hypothetical protein
VEALPAQGSQKILRGRRPRDEKSSFFWNKKISIILLLSLTVPNTRKVVLGFSREVFGILERSFAGTVQCAARALRVGTTVQRQN